MGAGPAGLTLALLLAKEGARVDVLEKRPAPRGPKEQASFGIVLNTISINLLRGTGVELDDIATRIYGRVPVTADGQALGCQTYGPDAIHTYNSVPRLDMVARLAAAAEAEGATISYESKVVQLNADSGLLAVCNSDDRKSCKNYDLVVAADGINSRGRRAIAPLSGYEGTETDGISWASTAVTLCSKLPANHLCMSSRSCEGGSALDVLIPMRGAGALLTMFPSSWASRGRLRTRYINQLMEKPGLLSLLPDLRATLHGLPTRNFKYAHPALWSSGRVVLVGDAAHGAPPHTGGGCNAAIADSFALTAHVERAGSLANAFADYELERKPIAESISRMTRAHGARLLTGQFASPYSAAIRRVQRCLEPFGYRTEYQRTLFELVPSLPARFAAAATGALKRP